MMTLDRWIQFATKGLCASAIEQVRAEIGEHYQAAYETALREGASPSAAHHRAVASLGDPLAAKREYHKVLLTRVEDEWLKAVGRRGDSFPQVMRWVRWIALAAVIGLLRLSQLAFSRDMANFGVQMLALTAMIGMGVLPLFLPLRTPSASRRFLVVKWTTLAVVVAVLVWSSGAQLSVIVGLLLYQAVMAARIRRKLPVKEWPGNLYYL